MANDIYALYKVLVQEYNYQNPDSPIPDAVVLGQRQQVEADVEKEFPYLTDEERSKKVNSWLVKEFYTWLHDNNKQRSALCFSGGGIRSATFGLGLLQGFTRLGMLGKFDYLSTVSGGGYLGGWLSAWIYRKGFHGVERRLENAKDRKWPLQPEPEPVQHLRTYSNYMSPKVGLLSADTWTLVAIFLRNLLLNWLILVPLIMAVLMFPRMSFWLITHEGGEITKQFVFWLSAALGIFAIAYIYANRPSLANAALRDKPNNKPGSVFPNAWKYQGWFLALCLVPLVISAFSITVYYAWLQTPIEQLRFHVLGFRGVPAWLAFTLFGIMLHLGGRLVSRFWVKKTDLREFIIAVFAGGLGGLFTWLAALKFFPRVSSVEETAFYVCFAGPLFLLLFLSSVTIFVGIASYVTSDPDREWLARAAGWLIIASVVIVVFGLLVIFGPVIAAYLGTKMRVALASTSILSGLVTLILGRSSKSPANKKEEAKGGGIPNFVLMLAAAIFAASILVGLAYLTGWLIEKFAPVFGLIMERRVTGDGSIDQHGLLGLLYHTPGRVLVALFVALSLVGLIAGWFININKFSLHAGYRDRIIRAYLGASRSNWERKPNPFTGLDEHDDLKMTDLRTQLFEPDSFKDLDGFITKLQTAADTVSKFVKDNLSVKTEELLRAYPPLGTAKKDKRRNELQEALLIDLNDLIRGDIIGPVSSFVAGKLPDETKKLLRDYLQFNVAKKARYRDELQKALLVDLNKLIQESPIDGKAPLPLASVISEIKELCQQVPLVETTRLNRLLLELSYPAELSPHPRKPLHVLSTTLNLVGGENLAWQNRKAESLTVSPLHSGSYCVGYRDSKDYGEGITLGTAVAISGAAASPNMGYHSSPLVTFLLTLFNVRLGWWLGNPGKAGNGSKHPTYNVPGPRFAVRPIMAEAFGLTDDDNPYVYLTDGGHFENLGIYEMVLRRCRFIVVCDGTSDPDYNFHDLAGAVSKIRVDFGVPIKFVQQSLISLKPEDGRPARHGYCALAHIGYSSVDKATNKQKKVEDGILLYIKASINNTEPIDVFTYKQANPAFPHESTGDQMYSEEQFESYRELGSHIVEHIGVNVSSMCTLEEFFNQVATKFGQPPTC